MEDEITSPSNNDLSSSQSDSTYRPSSDISNCENESQRSAGDRNEPSVSRGISCLLEVICLEHKRSDDYQFSVELDIKALLIPICGAFSRTTPDISIRVEVNDQILHIFDIEACVLHLLCMTANK